MPILRRDFLSGLTTLGAASIFNPSPVATQSNKQGLNKPVIDAHAHWYPQAFVDLLVKEGPLHGAIISGPNKSGDYSQEDTRYRQFEGFAPAPEARVVPSAQDAQYREGSTFNSEMRDVNLILDQMLRREVDMYALSMTHPMVYWAPPEFGLKLSETANNATSSVHAQYPKRFVGTIMLPLQDPSLAVRELERAAKLPGMRAINLAEHINGKNLSDKSLWPVWERCEKLGLPLFLHNLDSMDYKRMVQRNFSMMNSVGNPFEAGLAATDLILGGVLDEFPKLDVYLPHAGGTFPWLVWRVDYAQNVGQYRFLKQPASSYLRRFHYDLIVHNPKLMRVLIDMVGVDRIVSGTDFPQGMAVKRPVEMVNSIPGITQREREMILCENPARILKL